MFRVLGIYNFGMQLEDQINARRLHQFAGQITSLQTACSFFPFTRMQKVIDLTIYCSLHVCMPFAEYWTVLFNSASNKTFFTKLSEGGVISISLDFFPFEHSF